MPIYAFPYPQFQPAIRIITAVSNSNPVHITTSFPHLYVNGTIVRLYIPLIYGMQQANQLTGIVLVTGPTTFDLSIDTTLFDPFVNPIVPPPPYTLAQVVPIGEVNETLQAAVYDRYPI